MVLMVQKEVAERIVGIKESLLSISVKAYGRPEIIRYVPASYFFSGAEGRFGGAKNFRNFQRIFPKNQREKIFETVKKGFSQKRKMLINNLKVDKDDFTACNIDEKPERKFFLWSNGNA